MSETKPDFEINEKAYNDYMATEPLRPQEVSDPGHLLYAEDRKLLQIMVDAQKAELGYIISDEYTDADGNTYPDATSSSMITGALLGESMNEPGYDQESADETVSEANNYETFIDGLDLSDLEKAKLIEMVSEENYREAVATAKEMDPNCEIPSNLREKFIKELMTYSLEEFREICDECEKPRFAIVPANEFKDKVENMDTNKHYVSQDGKSQRDVLVVEEKDEPYSNVRKVDTVRVGIIDRIPHPKQRKGAPIKLEARKKHEIERFSGKKKMDFAGPHIMATSYQQSLREAKRTGDNSVIIDNWEDGSGTVTILNPENLTDSRFVAYASFRSRDRRVRFFSSSPNGESGHLRGRAWVQVLEF